MVVKRTLVAIVITGRVLNSGVFGYIEMFYNPVCHRTEVMRHVLGAGAASDRLRTLWVVSAHIPGLV